MRRYLVTPIVPAKRRGVGVFERSLDTFLVPTIAEAVRHLTDGTGEEAIELPNEELAREGYDVSGSVRDEPQRMFAYPFLGGYRFFGVEEL